MGGTLTLSIQLEGNTMTPYLALNAIKQALSARDNDANRTWLSHIADARSKSPKSLKSWLADKPTVDMAQFRVNSAGQITSAWSPGRRSVTLKATQVLFDDSVRDFKGHTHLFHSDTVLIASDIWGDETSITVYVA